MRLPNVRLACVLLATLVASACAGRRVPLPADPGSPLVDLVGAYARVADICQGTRTMTAELALSGRVGQQRIRGRVLAGFAQPDAMRLEGLAPFGAPAFILVSRGGNATLVLPREEAVLRSARPEQVLEALTGVALAPQDLFTVLSGCVTAADPPVSGTQHAGGWATITLRGGTVLFLKRVRNAWELRAARRGTLLIEYPQWQGQFPGVVSLRSGSQSALRIDLTAAVSQVQANIDLGAEAFTVAVPPTARALSMDDLRAAGPLHGEP